LRVAGIEGRAEPVGITSQHKAKQKTQRQPEPEEL